MITEQHVRWIALFFLFSLLDERVAAQATLKTVTALKARLPVEGTEDPSLMRIRIIEMCEKNRLNFKKQALRSAHILTFSGWSLPDHVDMGPWARFQKEASEEELLSVIFSRILGFSDEEIAEGLKVTVGTTRYRVGRGLRHLGETNKMRT